MGKTCPLCHNKSFEDTEFICPLHGVRLASAAASFDPSPSGYSDASFREVPHSSEADYIRSTAPIAPPEEIRLPDAEGSARNAKDTRLNMLYVGLILVFWMFFDWLSASTMTVCALLIIRARRHERTTLSGTVHGLEERQELIDADARWRRTVSTGAPHAKDSIVRTFDLTDEYENSVFVKVYGELRSGVIREHDEIIVTGKFDKNWNFFVNGGRMKGRAMFVWANAWSAEQVRAASAVCLSSACGIGKWLYDIVYPIL